MPTTATLDAETIRKRRIAALNRIRSLQATVSARNTDLSPEEAEDIAEELSRAAIETLRERGEVSFERDGDPGST